MRWSREEVALLSLKYATTSWTELLSFFPNRSKYSIKFKAKALGLTRPRYSTKKGKFFLFAICPRHGKIFRSEIRWGGKNGNIPYCPRLYCNKRLRCKPYNNQLRKKYRLKQNEGI